MKNTLTLEQFDRLREHLSGLDAMVERFCKEYGYEERTTALGRYPRRRVSRYSVKSICSLICKWIWMTKVNTSNNSFRLCHTRWAVEDGLILDRCAIALYSRALRNYHFPT